MYEQIAKKKNVESIDHKNNNGGVERQNLYGNKYGNTKSWYLKLKREEKRVKKLIRRNFNRCRCLIGSSKEKAIKASNHS
jgi:hypothetical protein